MKCINCQKNDAYEYALFCGEQCSIEYYELVRISMIDSICQELVEEIFVERKENAKS